jgi:hypothetical protein
MSHPDLERVRAGGNAVRRIPVPFQHDASRVLGAQSQAHPKDSLN